MAKKKRKEKYEEPQIDTENLTVNQFFDSRYIDSMPSLFGSFEVMAASGGGGGCSSSSHGCVCLLPNTFITLNDQTSIVIQNVKKGMILFDKTPKGALVTACYPHLRTDGYIQINEGIISATIDHEFWINNKNSWVKANEIEINDLLVTDNGKCIQVNKTTFIKKHQLVYNIELNIDKDFYYANGIKTRMIKLLPSSNSAFWSQGEKSKSQMLL